MTLPFLHFCRKSIRKGQRAGNTARDNQSVAVAFGVGLCVQLRRCSVFMPGAVSCKSEYVEAQQMLPVTVSYQQTRLKYYSTRTYFCLGHVFRL